MQDAWRAYLELALGLTEASKKRAQGVARKLVGQSGATAAQLQTMAEELVSTGMANREALTRIVRVEVDRALSVLGLASSEEITALTERVRRLERELAAPRPARPGTDGPAGGPVDGGPSAGKAVARRAASEPTVIGGPVAKKALAKKAVAKKAVAKKAVAKKAVAKTTVAKKTVVKKTVAKKTGAKKATTEQDATEQTTALAKGGGPGTGTPGKAVAKRAVATKAVAAKTPGSRRAPVVKRSAAPGTGAA